MGDLQESGIESLLTLYGEDLTSVLNADVLQVGHHGSHNATTTELLRAVTPRVVVIPMGPWTFGQGSTRTRAQPKSVMLAAKGRKFNKSRVRKAIY